MSEKSKTIQEKIDELDTLVAWFDGEDFVLEDAMAQFKKAEELAEEIEKDLNNMKNEVTLIRQKFSETTDV